MKTNNLYSNFMNAISNLTLVGEYVDSNTSYLKYEKLTTNLFFNSMIHNHYNSICLDIEKSYGIFEQYGLYIAPIEKIEENITDIETISSTLNNFAEMIQSTSVVVQEEGSVLYYLIF